MTINITIQNNSTALTIPSEPDLEGYTMAALSGRIDNTEMTIRIVDEEESAELNKNYRNKSGPTNVLAFPAELPKAIRDEINILGDIVVCAPIVEKEAIEQEKAFGAHWAHLIIHGTLHLLSYHHQDEESAQEMEKIEVDILAELGFPNPYTLQEGDY